MFLIAQHVNNYHCLDILTCLIAYIIADGWYGLIY